MLLINLIAARRAERRRLELIRAVLSRCMVGVGISTVFGAAMMTYSIQTTRNRILDMDEQMARLQDTVMRVERLQGDMRALQPQVATLLKAQNATNRWRAVLQEVGASLEYKTWITSFTSQETPSSGFVLTGQAVSQDHVGKTMQRLGRQTYIKSVDLHYTQSSDQANVVNFELAGTLQTLEGSSDGK